MRSFRHIRTISTLFLFLVFLSGTIPMSAIHRLMAGHTEAQYDGHQDGKQKIARATVHCHCNNFVTTSPFIDQSNEVILGVTRHIPKLQEHFHSELCSSSHFHYQFRGPPATA
ncbi:MAG TPA: hypothetical protein PLA61_13065 [Ferruginibacter sp.]|nr:hypothetical protein [Ferruginibacter sp.]MBN8700888.1 hypothetical protein [Chitinophagales bacterium]HQR01773.1 hypothetical protein [Ferruginibacter sp.]